MTILNIEKFVRHEHGRDTFDLKTLLSIEALRRSPAERYLKASSRFTEVSQDPEAPARDVRKTAKAVLRVAERNPDFLSFGEYETIHRDPRLASTPIEKRSDEIATQHPHFESWMKAKNARPTDPIIED